MFRVVAFLIVSGPSCTDLAGSTLQDRRLNPALRGRLPDIKSNLRSSGCGISALTGHLLLNLENSTKLLQPLAIGCQIQLLLRQPDPKQHTCRGVGLSRWKWHSEIRQVCHEKLAACTAHGASAWMVRQMSQNCTGDASLFYLMQPRRQVVFHCIES